MKILVAEDEPKVRSFIQQALEEAGMVVDAVATVPELLTSLKTTSYEVVVLDRLLKGTDSLDSIAELRNCRREVKILILSALAEVQERVKGLTEGADDYLGKPFHVAELIARVRSLMRRGKAEEKGTELTYEDLRIELDTQKVFRGEKRIEVSGKEFRILCLLAKNPGQVFSKSQLLDLIWDLNHFPESNVVEVTISSLRNKTDKGCKPLIQSRRGVGYWLGEP